MMKTAGNYKGTLVGCCLFLCLPSGSMVLKLFVSMVSLTLNSAFALSTGFILPFLCANLCARTELSLTQWPHTCFNTILFCHTTCPARINDWFHSLYIQSVSSSQLKRKSVFLWAARRHEATLTTSTVGLAAANLGNEQIATHQTKAWKKVRCIYEFVTDIVSVLMQTEATVGMSSLYFVPRVDIGLLTLPWDWCGGWTHLKTRPGTSCSSGCFLLCIFHLRIHWS